MDSERCIRCGREVDIDSDEFASGEAVALDDPNDEEGTGYVCKNCVTPEELQAADEDFMVTTDAMKSWRKEVGVTTGATQADYVEEKVRENRLRRMAERQGLRLEKSRRRDPWAYDYRTYRLVDPYTNALVAYSPPTAYGMSLDDIERALMGHLQDTNQSPKGDRE